DADVDDDIKYKSNGLILYTDVNSIRKYVKKCTNRLVVICTYQSSNRLAEACGDITYFNLGIFDEAHKTVGQGQVNKQFSSMLTNKNMIIDKRLFMTATPRMYNGNLDNE